MKPALLLLLAFGVPAAAGQHRVVIDPGHGGGGDAGSQAARSLSASNNATSPSGLLEKDLTLELSLEIKKQIAALASAHRGTRIECVLTRTDDRNPDFAKRAAICAAGRIVPAAIVSIHFNASTAHHSLGTLAMVHHKGVNPNYERDHAFATGLTRATHAAVARFLPASVARETIPDNHLHHGSGSNFFYQLDLRPALKAVPKCFLEVEFIDRRDVDQQLLQHRQETFPVIARAIAAFLYQQCGQADD
jgi:N-acetylmuramoyl-L-alanine amidase